MFQTRVTEISGTKHTQRYQTKVQVFLLEHEFFFLTAYLVDILSAAGRAGFIFHPQRSEGPVALDDIHHNFDHVRDFDLGADDVQRLEPGPATGSAL